MTSSAFDRVGLRGDHPHVHEKGARLPERPPGHVRLHHLRQARRLVFRRQGSRGHHPPVHRLGRRRQRVGLFGDEGETTTSTTGTGTAAYICSWTFFLDPGRAHAKFDHVEKAREYVDHGRVFWSTFVFDLGTFMIMRMSINHIAKSMPSFFRNEGKVCDHDHHRHLLCSSAVVSIPAALMF